MEVCPRYQCGQRSCKYYKECAKTGWRCLALCVCCRIWQTCLYRKPEDSNEKEK